MMILFANEFTEKSVKKYIDEGLWLNCSLSDFYFYLEYYDEGGYGSVHKVMDKKTGAYMILKRSSKKDFVPGSLKPYFTTTINGESTPTLTDYCQDKNLKVSKEAEFMVKVHEKLGGLKLFDYYDDDDHYILVMENGGRSLESKVSSHRKKILDLIRYEAYQSNFFYKLYLEQIIRYLIAIYHKIKSLHDLGIHHNDLKPENILLSENLESQLTIIDFGVAKKVEKYYESYKGTLEYIPYEYVSKGSYKPWDHTIWCFGIMLHFLALMKYPFVKEEEVLEYNLNKQKIDKLPPTFSKLIYDCLQKNPSNRPQNLLERLQSLETY
jgi:serine/threonine protein kinase